MDKRRWFRWVSSFSRAAPVAAPTVADISPSTMADYRAGTALTITGTGFTGTPVVTVGGVACGSVVVVGPTSITCTQGAFDPTVPGVYDVVVGAGTGTGLFTIPNAGLISITPNSGGILGGDNIDGGLLGWGMTDDVGAGLTAVTFGGTSATDVGFSDDHTGSCTTPLHLPGVVDVVATIDGANYTLTAAFTYS